MNKSEAKRIGAKRYTTGKPCKRGHVAERWVSTGMCVECLNVRAREEYWGDPDKARAKARSKYRPEYASSYYAENKDKVIANNQAWLAANGDRKRFIDEEYRRINAEKVKAARKKWAAENPEKVRAKDRTRDARIRGSDGSHTAKDILSILETQGHKCVYCPADLRQGYHVDHIMPLALGGSNWPSNLQCLCPTCNVRKGAKHPDIWHSEIGYLHA